MNPSLPIELMQERNTIDRSVTGLYCAVKVKELQCNKYPTAARNIAYVCNCCNQSSRHWAAASHLVSCSKH